MHSPTSCTLLHLEKKILGTLPGKKPTPAKKLMVTEAAMAAMEADDHEEDQANSENEACHWWIEQRWWGRAVEYLSKMAIVTIFFFILLAINGGNVFVFLPEGCTNWWVLSSLRGALWICCA
jgi:hypothetical protein